MTLPEYIIIKPFHFLFKSILYLFFYLFFFIFNILDFPFYLYYTYKFYTAKTDWQKEGYGYKRYYVRPGWFL